MTKLGEILQNLNKTDTSKFENNLPLILQKNELQNILKLFELEVDQENYFFKRQLVNAFSYQLLLNNTTTAQKKFIQILSNTPNTEDETLLKQQYKLIKELYNQDKKLLLDSFLNEVNEIYTGIISLN